MIDNKSNNGVVADTVPMLKRMGEILDSKIAEEEANLASKYGFSSSKSFNTVLTA